MEDATGVKMPEDEMNIRYTFTFPDASRKTLAVRLDKESLRVIRTTTENSPDWAKLESFGCPHCPLDKEQNSYCPLAINLSALISEFRTFPSYQSVSINVETNNRNYQKDSSLQAGVSSILGVLMVSSGCPVMGKLKPLLHFHMPFATLEETQVRVLSTYLLSQYIKWKRGGDPDWEMHNLVNIYEDIRVLNHSVSRKIANLEEMDTSINSLIILNNFADYVTFTIDEKMIDEMESVLQEFMK